MSESLNSLGDDQETKLSKLSTLLKCKENEIQSLKSEILRLRNSDAGCTREHEANTSKETELSSKEIERYSRQILIPQFGVKGQFNLKNSSVLIVGAGGLGCPAGMYLAAAGIGTIGIVDYDKVEISNLHRQISHEESSMGVAKCVSLAHSLKSINSSLNYIPYNFQLNSKNIKSVLEEYDVVIDASDNVPTRYLLNDACVIYKKPLVSGSALRLEGHLTVYNLEDSPCYRCIYPHPPTPSATTNCSDAGVLGPVTGVIGSLQALEAMKIAARLPVAFKNKMLVFDGEFTMFRTFNLRGKNPSCEICGVSPTITELIDYEVFCQTSAVEKSPNISLLPDSHRVTCAEYKKVLEDKIPHLLVDVRPPCEYNICSLSNSINIPYNNMLVNQANSLRNAIEEHEVKTLYFICRRGNDSQRAIQLVDECLKDLNLICHDIKGGLQAWHYEIDTGFPLY